MSQDVALEVGRLYKPIKDLSDNFSIARKEAFLSLPGITAYWPMSIVDTSGKATELTSGVGPLFLQGTPLTGYDNDAYRVLSTTPDYFYTSSTLGLTGTEAYIDPTLRGFTFGCWFNLQLTPANNGGVISKDGTNPQRGYSMAIQTSRIPFFRVSSTGANGFSVISTATMVLGQWHFMVARFTPSTEMAIFVDGIKTVNTTSIPASQFVSSQQFEVGRYVNNNNNCLDGWVRDVFVCQSILDDGLIANLRQSTQPGN